MSDLWPISEVANNPTNLCGLIGNDIEICDACSASILVIAAMQDVMALIVDDCERRSAKATDHHDEVERVAKEFSKEAKAREVFQNPPRDAPGLRTSALFEPKFPKPGQLHQPRTGNRSRSLNSF